MGGHGYLEAQVLRIRPFLFAQTNKSVTHCAWEQNFVSHEFPELTFKQFKQKYMKPENHKPYEL